MGERSDEPLTRKGMGMGERREEDGSQDHCCREYRSRCNYRDGLDLRVLRVYSDLPCRPRLYT